MNGTENINHNNPEKQNQVKNNLNDYLNSELKLQDEIDKKLQDPKLQELAKKELLNIKEKFQENLDETNILLKKGEQSTILNSKQELKDLKNSFVVEKLVDKFQQSVNALNIIEENYKKYNGFNEFINLLNNDDIGEEQKGKIYTIFTDDNYSEFLEDYMGQRDNILPKTKIDITSFIEYFKDKSIIKYNNSEILEILSDEKNLENKSLNELVYIKNKLISSRNTDEKNKEKINHKLADLDVNIDIKIKEEQVNLKIEKKNNDIEKKNYEIQQEIIKQKKLIPLIKDFPFEKINGGKDLKKLISALEKADNINSIEISKDIAALLIKGDILYKILSLSKNIGEETYNNIYDFFSGIAIISQNNELKTKLAENKIIDNNSPKDLSKSILSGYLGNTGKVIKDGDKFIQGDIRIDMGGKPPIIETFNKKTGYSLNIENKYSKEVDLNAQLRTDTYKNMLDLKTKENENKSNIELFKSYLLDSDKLQEFAQNEGKSIDEIKSNILEVINNLEQENIKLEEKYIKERANYVLLNNKDFSKDIEKKQEEQRQTLKFLHLIGFDLMPQNISDAIIARINTQKYMGMINNGKHGLQIYGKIDLSKGEFGEGNLSTINKKELFTKLFNLILTGDSSKPINVDNVVNNRGTGITRNQINEILYNKENGIIDGISGVKYNKLEEHFRGKDKEKEKLVDKKEIEKK